MSYEILEHTADVKFRAKGTTKKEAFSEAVKAFSEIVGAEPNAGETRHKVNITSENLNTLLYDFLGELIYLQDTEDVVVTHADSMEIKKQDDDTWRLESVIWTDPILNSMSLLDIKAPTYNEMVIDHEGQNWVLEAVMDI